MPLSRWKVENGGWILEAFVAGEFSLTCKGIDGRTVTATGLDDGCLDDLRRVLASAFEMDSTSPVAGATVCPSCARMLQRFTEAPGYNGPPRFFCPNLACDVMASPVAR